MKTQDDRPATRRVLPLLLNALMGIPAVIPIWLLWYMAVNWPLAALGLTVGEPTENDGMLPWFLFAGPIITAFGLVWWLINRRLRRGSVQGPWTYWLSSTAATVLPTFALVLLSSMGD